MPKGRPSELSEHLRNRLKKLCIEWATRKMEGKDERLKMEIVLKVLPKVFPTEIAGENGGPLTIEIIKYADIKKNTPSVQIQA